MVFKPVSQNRRQTGILLSMSLILLNVLLFSWLPRRNFDTIQLLLIFLLLLLLPLTAFILYRTWVALTLKYKLDRDALTIHWGNQMQIVPLQRVRRVLHHGVTDQGKPSLFHWPATQVRLTSANQLPPIWLLATQPLHQCMVLDAGDVAFAISPHNLQDFLAAIQEYYRMGPQHNRQLVRINTGYWYRLFEVGGIGAILLGLGLIGVILLWGLLMVNYGGLPERVMTVNGEVSRTSFLLLPYMGLVAWLLNGLWGLWMAWREQPTGAYLLWGGAVIVQICALFALNSILP